MEYVMVPVPEEIVAEVEDFMKWKVAAPTEAPNPDALRQVYDEADSALREIIDITTDMTLREELPTLLGMAEATGLSPRELVGAVGDLHGRVVAAGRPVPLIMIRDDPRERPEDRVKWLHRVLHMSDADAALVADF